MRNFNLKKIGIFWILGLLVSIASYANNPLSLKKLAAKKIAAAVKANPLTPDRYSEDEQASIAQYINPAELACNEAIRKQWSSARQKGLITHFLSEFVKIPGGLLPGRNGAPAVAVAEFETLRHPVTREIWDFFLKNTPEDQAWWNRYVPAAIQQDWNLRPSAPVTHVAFEEGEDKNFAPAEVQVFLAKLNKLEEKTGCTYRLPTDHEIRYKMRGDPEGTNHDQFSKGVSNANVDEYFTYSDNSNPDGHGKRVQPVGYKKPNLFGIELGNIRELSSDMYNPKMPQFGRATWGGSWRVHKEGVGSDRPDLAYAGDRFDDVGFSLVRTCR